MAGLEITVQGPDAAQAGRFASELETVLRGAAPDVVVTRRKESGETMELGSALVVLAGSAAATALAKGVAAWLAKRATSTVKIGPDGEVFAGNLTSADVLKLTQMVLAAQSK